MRMGALENPAFFTRRIYEPPATLGAAANAIAYNPGRTGTKMLDLYFHLVNTSQTTTRIVQVGIDVGRTAALTQHCFYEPIPAAGQTGMLGPFPFLGSDQIMAWADAANDVDMFFWMQLEVYYAIGGP